MADVRPNQVQRSLQDLRIELGILTARVAVASGLRPPDLDILDVAVHDGPISPTGLARRTGVHPATMTGVLARLERDGWVARRRNPADGRSAMIEPVPDRTDRIGQLYADANLRMGDILAKRTPGERAVINAFLTEVIHAARAAADGLDPHPGSASPVDQHTSDVLRDVERRGAHREAADVLG